MTNATKTKHTTIYVVTGATAATKIVAVKQALHLREHRLRKRR